MARQKLEYQESRTGTCLICEPELELAVVERGIVPILKQHLQEAHGLDVDMGTLKALPGSGTYMHLDYTNGGYATVKGASYAGADGVPLVRVIESYGRG